jgi:signal transduction histidine kinase/ligand-binding sensor domain-containing protein
MALDPALDVSQYAHTAWRIRDGFTKGTVNTIAQTPDGYLWLGTDFGLLRFDDVRATPWQPPAGEQLPGNDIRKLLVARDGTLWIATTKGLASWKNGTLTNYPEVAGQFLLPLMEDREGTIWFGTLAPGRLCSVQHGTVQCYGAGSFGRGVFGLYEDQKGYLWVAADKGLWRWKPGIPQQYLFPSTVNEALSLIENDDGTLLLSTNAGVEQLARGKIEPCTLPGITGHFRPGQFLRSSDGSLWIGGRQGLVRLHQGRTDTFGVRDGLSGDYVASIFEDREGNVWVSTNNGLDRFRDYAVLTASANQGLSMSGVWSVQATSDGSIWMGTPTELNRLENGRVTVYGRGRPRQGSAKEEDREVSTVPSPRQVANSGLSGTPLSLGQDDQGRLLVSTANGLFFFQGDRFIQLPGVPGGNVFSIAADGRGTLWMSNLDVGVFYVSSQGPAQPIPWSRFGQKSFGGRVLPDRSKGGVWLGFFQGGIAYLKDGLVHALYSTTEGLGGGSVNDLRFGSRGAMWAATEGGLSRIKDGRIATLTSQNGLPCDEVHWSAEDDDHFVWLNMACGLARIARSELDAWVSDPKRKVQATLFDASDGVRTVGRVSGFGPLVTKSPDGKLWFGTPDGVQIIDPRHLPFNKVPPPVHIEQITADRKTYDAARGLTLPPLVRDLTIDYTALSLAVPEKVHFRFKLEGQDKDWREVVNDRQVQYSNLRPGPYRFRVTACNNSGVWNEEGAFLAFSIAPAYYQTNWFRALCVAAFLALLLALHQLRLRQATQEFNMRLDERVNERTRIARELHDTLLQSFQGLVIRFQAARNQLPHRPEEASEALDSALVSADRALEEGRGSIQQLRSELLKKSSIEQMLLAMGKEPVSSQNGEYSSPPLRVIVEGTQRAIRAMITEEIYRIARELLRNTYRHAHARSIEAELRYDDDAFVLIVRDDGKGIDPIVLKGRGRAGHWGLPGAYERAEGIGARLDIWSEAGAGTEVRLTVPGAIAYEKSSHGGRFRLFRKTRIYEHGP